MVVVKVAVEATRGSFLIATVQIGKYGESSNSYSDCGRTSCKSLKFALVFGPASLRAPFGSECLASRKSPSDFASRRPSRVLATTIRCSGCLDFEA
jgi:hypothetical protein